MNTGLNKTLTDIARLQSVTNFRRDQLLIDRSEESLRRINESLQKLYDSPLCKNQAE